MNRQICASCYVVDFDNKSLLMMYNKKLEKWLQPGGHLEGAELPIDTAIREVKEETGIDIEIIGNTFNEITEPIAVEVYNTKIGSMIDIQYVGIPLNKEINTLEDSRSMFIAFDEILSSNNIDDEIKEKFKYILDNFRAK